jgi:hypothetical protein
LHHQSAAHHHYQAAHHYDLDEPENALRHAWEADRHSELACLHNTQADARVDAWAVTAIRAA